MCIVFGWVFNGFFGWRGLDEVIVNFVDVIVNFSK